MDRQVIYGVGSYSELFDLKTSQLFQLEKNRARVGISASSYFSKYYGCSQSILLAFMDILELEDPFWLRAIGGLQGGGGCGLTCGALNTGFVLISAKLGRERIEEGVGGIVPMLEPCHRLCEWFKLQYKSTVCSEISGCNWFDLREVARLHDTVKGKEQCEKCATLTGVTAYKIAEILGGSQ